MKTTITTANLSDSKIKEAFNNPFGMSFENNLETRKAVSDHAKGIIKKLHEERKALAS